MAEKTPKVNIKKVPVWVWIAAGGGALIGVFLILRNNAAGSSAAGTQPVATDVNSLFSSITDSVSKFQETVNQRFSDFTTQQQQALSDALAGVNSTIGQLSTQITANTATGTALQDRIRAVETAIQQITSGTSGSYAQLQNQITSLQTILSTLAASQRNDTTAIQYEIQAALDGARAQLGKISGNWYNASLASIISLLNSQPNLLAGQPLRDFLISLVPASGTLTGYNLPVQPVPLPASTGGSSFTGSSAIPSPGVTSPPAP